MRNQTLPAYIADNYGKCSITPCRCRAAGRWLGTSCPWWTPIHEEDWDALIDALNRRRHP